MSHLAQNHGNRNIRDISKMIRYRPEFGGAAETVDMRGVEWPCRFCSMPMYVVSDIGNSVEHSCSMIGCPGNQDTRMKFDTDAAYKQHVSVIGNTDRIWRSWTMPKPII